MAEFWPKIKNKCETSLECQPRLSPILAVEWGNIIVIRKIYILGTSSSADILSVEYNNHSVGVAKIRLIFYRTLWTSISQEDPNDQIVKTN